MKLFVTGASGYIRSVVLKHAVRAGYTVEGLARNQESAVKVARLNATPVAGDLHSLDVLTAAASRAVATTFIVSGAPCVLASRASTARCSKHNAGNRLAA
jgi:uncharacterized protein YbjT (DUF2867 family)